MKPLRNVMGVVLCSCLIASLPFAPLPKAVAATTNNYEEALKVTPASVKRMVERTVGYFGWSDFTVYPQKSGNGAWEVTLNNHAADSSHNHKVPSSVTLFFSEKDNKLTQLTAAWSQPPKSDSVDLETAVHTAEDFVETVIGEHFAAAKNAIPIFDSKAQVSVYPIVNDIPVQKTVGRMIIDSTGNLTSYHQLDTYFDEHALPSKAGILSEAQAKAAISNQLKLELAYDDEQQLYQYVALPYDAIDAKTGEGLAIPYEYADTPMSVKNVNTVQNTTAASAKAIAQSFFGLSGEQISASASRESHPNETPISVFTLSDGKKTVVLRVNEQTRDLLSIDSTDESNDQDGALTSKTEAKKAALGFIKRFIPLKNGDYLIREQFLAERLPPWVQAKSLPHDYKLELYANVNGVRTAKPILSITFDLAENALTSVRARTYTLPATAATPTVISADAAKKQWQSALQAELNYVYPSFLSEQSDQPILAYVSSLPAARYYVNAISGIVSELK